MNGVNGKFKFDRTLIHITYAKSSGTKTNANANNIEATIPVNLKSKSASNHLETATTNSIANSTYAAATGTRLITQQSLPVGMLNTVGEESNSGYEAAPNGNVAVGQGNPAYQSTDF